MAPWLYIFRLSAHEAEGPEREKEVKLNKAQFEIIKILWSSSTPLSIKQIADKTKRRFAKVFLTEMVVEDMLSSGALFQSGSYTNNAGHRATVALYSPTIHFDDYYTERFRIIPTFKIAALIKKLIESMTFDLELLCDMEKTLKMKVDELQ